MNLFYTKELDNCFFRLVDEEAYHCTKVLRFKVNDTIFITNGEGFLAKGKIISLKRYSLVEGQIDQILSNSCQKPEGIYLYVSILKNTARFEWLVEKCSELRVKSIVPLICQRTQKNSLKVDRLQRICIEAMKQSFSAYLTKIHEPIFFTDAVYNIKNTKSVFLATCVSSEKVNLLSLEKGNYAVFIGPEGDFSTEEINLATSLGVKLISLGDVRLRSETAAIFIASCFYFSFNIKDVK